MRQALVKIPVGLSAAAQLWKTGLKHALKGGFWVVQLSSHLNKVSKQKVTELWIKSVWTLQSCNS